ncbi:hypothetical protein mRhiFer1_007996 [Rhinolophus ferrumequinum]|uniref:Uncharacterized protein n=1 Tax=Rhinolophus ferrumequinum TaxID=59479 RepID=A0A7J7WQQ2_RHIFE|nr:hypothetical protein mRhiFer1_007996 [Rhinolophus ferrumequinum]
MWDTKRWSVCPMVFRGRGEPEQSSLQSHGMFSPGTTRWRGWGHHQQPSQSGGLGRATGVWGRQPGSRRPTVRPATCVLSIHGLSQAHREQGAAAPVSLAPTHTARDMASVLSNAPAFLQRQSLLLHVEVAVNFFQELPFEDLPAGCCRRARHTRLPS